MTLARKVAALEDALGRLPSLLVALSGGVDSAVLVALAARSVPGPVAAATTFSAAVPPEEVETARDLARRCSVPHHVVATDELSDPAYRANDGRRCYFCRQSMYGALWATARAEGLAHLADGLQADDLVADRPGVAAADEHRVLHPLRAAGLNKSDLRRLAQGLGLPVHDKPAQPCLASRLPIGVGVTVERLSRVLSAERAVAALGYRELRVRCEEQHGRIEIGAAELARALAEQKRLIGAVVEAGFATASVDPLGYRS
ncbi:MAG: ATP-dependent sacrificial sulfur transferase LarE [Planctomycetota bacterium]|jgi:uncharacterized protein